MRFRSWLATLLLPVPTACLFNPAGGGAQPQAIVLRVTYPDSSRRQADVLFAAGDSVVLHDRKAKERLVIREGFNGHLDIYRGQHHRSRAAAHGAGIGALIGAAAGAILVAIAPSVNLFGDEGRTARPVGKGALLGAVEGAATGAGIGAMSGRALWEPITLLRLKQELCRCPEPR